MMLSTANLLSPSDGGPVVAPTQDMILGCYYLTLEREDTSALEAMHFADEQEALLAYEVGLIDTREGVDVAAQPLGAQARAPHPDRDQRPRLGRGTRRVHHRAGAHHGRPAHLQPDPAGPAALPERDHEPRRAARARQRLLPPARPRPRRRCSSTASRASASTTPPAAA